MRLGLQNAEVHDARVSGPSEIAVPNVRFVANTDEGETSGWKR